MARELERPVLLYDAECRFCRFAARIVERLDRDGQLAFLPLDASEADALLEPVPSDERFASWRLAMRNGALVGRGSGVAAVLRAAGRRRPAAILSALPDTALELGYDLVARNRGRLGRLVPDGRAPRSFP